MNTHGHRTKVGLAKHPPPRQEKLSQDSQDTYGGVLYAESISFHWMWNCSIDDRALRKLRFLISANRQLHFCTDVAGSPNLMGIFCIETVRSCTQILIQSLLFCTFGLLMLLLVLYQELVMGAYWENPIGFCTQAYFLPWILLASTIMSLFSPLMELIRVWPLYIVIWVSLFIASCAECAIKKRRS